LFPLASAGPGRRGLLLALSGVAAAGLYLGVSTRTLSQGGIGAVLFDGMAPPSRYRWVRPPAALARDNQAPSSGAGTVMFAGSASQLAFVYTGDAQALITFAPNAVMTHPGDASVAVTVIPRDPAAIAAPPVGLRFDGNAYEFHAAYSSSRTPAVLRRPVSIILRYASGASQLLRSTGSTWTVVPSADFPAAMQRTAEVDGLGVYVVAAPGDLPFVRQPFWWLYAAGGSVVLVSTGLILWITRSGRRRHRKGHPGRKMNQRRT